MTDPRLRPILPPPDWDPSTFTVNCDQFIGRPCCHCQTDTTLARLGAVCRECWAKGKR